MLLMETDMAEAIVRRFKNGVLQVPVGVKDRRYVLDVVAYDKKQRLFRVFECKLGSDGITIANAFGQISVYQQEISTRPHKFIDAFTDKPEIRLRWGRLMEATHGNRYIRVAFYVALTDSACASIGLIRSQKDRHPNVGVVRIKEDGTIKHYLKANGKRDSELAKAIPTVIAILQEMSDSPLGAILETA
jgi:hypothetical protein